MSIEIMDIDVRAYYITKLKLRLTNLPSTVATISCCPVCKKLSKKYLNILQVFTFRISRTR